MDRRPKGTTMPPMLNCVLCRVLAGLAIYVIGWLIRKAD
jgi:hypothetical protein